jgi:hypothetical protein
MACLDVSSMAKPTPGGTEQFQNVVSESKKG